MKDPNEPLAKPPWAKKTKPLANLGPHDEVDTADAVAFIAEQIEPSRTGSRMLMDAIQHRVKYAVDHGRLRRNVNGKLVFGELITWAQAIPEWQGAFSQFPSINPAVGGVAFKPMQVGGRGHTTPADYAGVVAALRDATLRGYALEDELRAKDEELARLRPLEIKALKKSADGRKYGKTGGRPPKR